MKATGILRYGNSHAVLDVDSGISDYYRSFIPKSISFNRPKFDPHVTVIRGDGYESPDMSKWKFRDGEEIEFEYNPEIKIGDVYIWLSVYSKDLESIRVELGLDECFDKFKWFHITIANMK